MTSSRTKFVVLRREKICAKSMVAITATHIHAFLQHFFVYFFPLVNHWLAPKAFLALSVRDSWLSFLLPEKASPISWV